MVERTIRASRWLSVTPWTNDLSIFSSSAADLLQVGQRREARAVVVDGDGDPGLGEPVEHGQRQLPGCSITAVSVISKQSPPLGLGRLRQRELGEVRVAQQCGRRC